MPQESQILADSPALPHGSDRSRAFIEHLNLDSLPQRPHKHAHVLLTMKQKNQRARMRGIEGTAAGPQVRGREWLLGTPLPRTVATRSALGETEDLTWVHPEDPSRVGPSTSPVPSVFLLKRGFKNCS